MTLHTGRRWVLATLLALLSLSALSTATLMRRDEHALVVPLTYEPTSDLFTASMSIGSHGSTYNLVVDTGSPFLVLQKDAFHPSPSTFDPQNGGQPDIGGGGYLFTTPDADKEGGDGEKPKMHFVTDTAWLNEAGGQRAGGAAKEGNVTVGLSQLDDLKEAQGILGLSPPFSMVGAGSAGGQQQQKGGGGAKGKRDAPAPSSPPAAGGRGDAGKGGNQASGKLPSLDVSFLHSFLSPDHRKTLGMTGSSHFYLDFTPSTINNPVPLGELVFPLTGTTVPTSASGYNFSAAISVDPSSGSTYPAHPFWGIAHRPDLRFVLDDAVLADVRIDAVLLDSGTSGVIGPPSEVAKIFAAAKNRIVTTPSPAGGEKVVLGKAACDATLRMGFELGARKRALFEALRRTAQPDGRFVEAKHDATDWIKRAYVDGWSAWKSYADNVHAGIHNIFQGLADLFHLDTPLAPTDGASLAKRHLLGMRRLHRRNPLLIGVGLLNNGSPAQDNAASQAEQCQVSLMGSPQVEAMFPSNGPDFKVWILGLEFFQSNLVYHNLDTAQTVVVPRNTPA
ncbi:uncharacterized protein SRS1_16778 [Sporisorium reilianum f. sp. reilianum]|uniref:Peptidase A1 domain-containing protein n=1 Tax=Sporisorium reilianum f. sp. reilianum TaxID=72559 RepID=A0A2N8UP71_9BASI|nr:uncharacterized protein SRS1_16778 [Sporisorium reilianum f. sp. reilianum]